MVHGALNADAPFAGTVRKEMEGLEAYSLSSHGFH